MTATVRVVLGDITVICDPQSSPLLRYTVRGLGGRIVRLRAPRGEVYRALIRECGLARADAARLLNQLDGGAR
ncbi:hypothetical protein GCM10009799_37430 [Nocardiopsis rhodophaea]|uniref:Uncharacterized protein n=1 Tax=Nocardiopsis rhodophaea TaxID=280238 RepID=A0ABP5EXQ3_9ACTN